MLESFLHEANSFITLTFSEEHLPDDASLSVRTLQLFLKRLRERVGAPGLRFFGVGEYGDETSRPHYHVALFGLRNEHPDGWRGRCPCSVCGAWRFGDVHAYELSRFLAQYMAGYVVKKMTSKEDPRLGGRYPEFSRMSRRPGIGAGAVEVLGKSVVDQETGEIHLVDEDVPSQFRMERKLWPLGRYLTRRLRLEVGLAEGQPAKAAELRKLVELLEYPTWRDRDRRQMAREQGARVAFARSEISRSKKIL